MELGRYGPSLSVWALIIRFVTPTIPFIGQIMAIFNYFNQPLVH